MYFHPFTKNCWDECKKENNWKKLQKREKKEATLFLRRIDWHSNIAYLFFWGAEWSCRGRPSYYPGLYCTRPSDWSQGSTQALIKNSFLINILTVSLTKKFLPVLSRAKFVNSSAGWGDKRGYPCGWIYKFYPELTARPLI